MSRRIVCALLATLVLGLVSAVAAASSPWRPARLARKVVVANLKSAVPGFKPSVGTARCSGQVTVARCTVRASVSNDDVTAGLTFRRHRDGTHLTYVDKLTLTAVMGGGTVTRTYYGKVFT